MPIQLIFRLYFGHISHFELQTFLNSLFCYYRIYTTMVGQKSSLDPLKTELARLGIVHNTQTEFCQGHTTRWGLAWTFLNNLRLETAFKSVSRKQQKKKPPLKYVVPKTCTLPEYSVGSAAIKLQELFLQLKMDCTEDKHDKHMVSYCVTAYENTWSNQRRKRRQGIISNVDHSVMSLVLPVIKILDEEACSTVSTSDSSSTKRSYESTDDNSEEVTKRKKVALGGDADSEATAELIPPLLKATVVVRKVSSEINVEMVWLEGTSGRDVIHQVLQYVKNNLK